MRLLFYIFAFLQFTSTLAFLGISSPPFSSSRLSTWQTPSVFGLTLLKTPFTGLFPLICTRNGCYAFHSVGSSGNDKRSSGLVTRLGLVSESAPPTLPPVPPPTIDVFSCSPQQISFTPNLSPLEVVSLAEQLPKPTSLVEVAALRETLPYFDDDMHSDAFRQLFGDYICFYRANSMTLELPCTDVTAGMDSSRVTFTARSDPAWRYPDLASFSPATSGIIHSPVSISCGWLEIYQLSVYYSPPIAPLTAMTSMIGCLWMAVQTVQALGLIFSFLLSLLIILHHKISPTFSLNLRKLEKRLSRTIIKSKSLVTRILRSTRDIARLAWISFVLHQLWNELPSVFDFIPFSGQVNDATSALVISLVKCTLMLWAYVLCEGFIDNKFAEHWDQEVVQSHGAPAKVDASTATSAFLSVPISLDVRNLPLLRRPSNEIGLPHGAEETDPSLDISGLPRPTVIITDVSDAISRPDVDGVDASSEQPLPVQVIEPAIDEGVEALAIHNSYQEVTVAISAAAQDLVADDNNPEAVEDSLISPITSEGSDLITPIDTGLFGTLQCLPDEEVISVMEVSRMLRYEKERKCSCQLCKEQRRSSRSESSMDSENSKALEVSAHQGSGQANGLNMLFDNQSFRIPQAATVTENTFFRPRANTTPSRSLDDSRGPAFTHRLREMVLTRQAAQHKRPEMPPPRESDESDEGTDEMVATSTPTNLAKDSEWEDTSASPRSSTTADFSYQVPHSLEQDGPSRDSQSCTSTLPPTSHIITSVPPFSGHPRGPEFIAPVKAMTLARIARQRAETGYSALTPEEVMNPPPTVGPENAVIAFRAFLQSTTAAMHARRQELALAAAENSSECSNDAQIYNQTDEQGSHAPTENDDLAGTYGNNDVSGPFADRYERECDDKHEESISDTEHPVEETFERDGSETSQRGFAHWYYPVSDMRSTSGSGSKSPLPNPRGTEFIAHAYAMAAKRINRQQVASGNNSIQSIPPPPTDGPSDAVAAFATFLQSTSEVLHTRRQNLEREATRTKQEAENASPSEPVGGRDSGYMELIPCTEQPVGESSEDIDHRSSYSSSSNTSAPPMGFPLAPIDLNQTPTGYRQQTQASRNKTSRGQKKEEASNPRQQQKKSNPAKSSRKPSHPASTTAINAMRRIAKKQQKQKLSLYDQSRHPSSAPQQPASINNMDLTRLHEYNPSSDWSQNAGQAPKLLPVTPPAQAVADSSSIPDAAVLLAQQQAANLVLMGQMAMFKLQIRQHLGADAHARAITRSSRAQIEEAETSLD